MNNHDDKKLLINGDKMSDGRRILPTDENIYDREKPINKKRKIIIGGIVIVLVIVGIILAVVFSKNSDDDNSGGDNPDPGPAPTPTPPFVPSGYNPYYFDESELISSKSKV